MMKEEKLKKEDEEEITPAILRHTYTPQEATPEKMSKLLKMLEIIKRITARGKSA